MLESNDQQLLAIVTAALQLLSCQQVRKCLNNKIHSLILLGLLHFYHKLTFCFILEI